MKRLLTNKFMIAGAAILLSYGSKAQTAASDDTSTFKPSGSVWGYVFGDYAYKTQNDSLGRGGGNVQYKGAASLNSGNVASAANPVPANVQTNAFQIRRMYLGYDYQFARNFSASAVLANEQTLLANNQNTVYLKYAFVKWSNIWKNSDLIIGQYQTASFATGNGTEPLWGYRAVERTLMDMHNIDGSTDLGASLQGKLWEAKNVTAEGKKPCYIGYYLQVGNGNSATPATAQFRKVRANLYVSMLNQKLVVGAYYDYVTQQFSPYKTSNTTYKGYLSFKNESFHLGAEFFQQTNQNSDVYKVLEDKTKNTLSVNDTASGVQFGFSVFGSVKIVKNKLNFFARYDMYNPDTKWSTNNVYSKAYSGITGSNMTSTTFYTQTFLTAGFDWTPDKRFHIMPNVWYNAYNSMMSSSYADFVGKPFSSRMVKDEDVVYRVTFYWLFNPSKKVNNNGFY